jgi:hypothetical protein
MAVTFLTQNNFLWRCWTALAVTSQRFNCVVWTTDTITESGVQRPHIQFADMNGIVSNRVWCTFSRHGVFGPILFQEQWQVKITWIALELFELYRQYTFQTLSTRWCSYTLGPEREFPNQWAGQEWPVSWPPCSPDINPTAFFPLGLCKGTDIQYECWKCKWTLCTVTPQMLENTQHEIKYCSNILWATTFCVMLSSKANHFSISLVLHVLGLFVTWWRLWPSCIFHHQFCCRNVCDEIINSSCLNTSKIEICWVFQVSSDTNNRYDEM